CVPLLPRVGAEYFAGNVYDLLDRQLVFLRKMEIPLVMSGHCHYGSLAVAHEDVVADPYWHRLAGERVRDANAGGHALLLDSGEVGFHHRAALAFFDEGRELAVALRRVFRQRMLGGDRAEGYAHDGVGAGGEDPELLVLAVELVGEGESHTVAL